MRTLNLSTSLVVALALTSSSLVGCTGQRGGTPQQQQQAADASASTKKVLSVDDVDDKYKDAIKGERFRVTYADGDMYKGAENPLVTIVEFSDFQCPYCARFTGMLDELVKDPAYKDDVRIVFKQFPLPMHKDAALGAEAALAAGAQGKAWEMHDKLFANPKAMTQADIEKYAQELGLDVAKFKADLDAHTYKAKVDAEMEQGKTFGVRGTPSFFINGMWQRGAPRTIDALKQLVDQEKKAAEELIKAGSKREEVYARYMRAGADKRVEPQKPPQQRAGEPDPKANYAVPVDGRPAFGPADALVTVIEFSDFQCPFCNRVTPTLQEIKKNYPQDVRVVFRQLPLGFHDRARPAAKASLAAAQQGKFWEMHDKLFANQKELTDQNFEAWAKELGLDTDKFKKDMADPSLEKMIAEDEQAAAKFGARGTPAFFVNGRFVSGAQPFAAFDTIIKEEKEKAEKFLKEKGVPKASLYEEMRKGWETELKVPPPPPPADFKRRDVKTDGLPGKGALKNPKVTIVECSDFDCPFCGRAAGTVKQIMDQYSDKVAFYFRQYPLPMHKMAEPAHRAALAANNQGKFWEMHDLLFADKSKRSDEDLKAFAGQLGLDVAKWEKDFKDPATAQKIQDDIAACSALEVRGAPGFLINGRLLSGAQPFEVFKGVIEEELAGGFEKKQAAAPGK
ncbi:MAG TPA: thioredoxin domain-containing protein [Nannocystaceae bacterium]|nr:thioredoxin domain-containing protein [Nannocystaceae bacterium]